MRSAVENFAPGCPRPDAPGRIGTPASPSIRFQRSLSHAPDRPAIYSKFPTASVSNSLTGSALPKAKTLPQLRDLLEAVLVTDLGGDVSRAGAAVVAAESDGHRRLTHEQTLPVGLPGTL